MPAFDPLNYVPSEGENEGDSMYSHNGIIDNGFPYGATGVVSMAVGFFIFWFGSPNMWLAGVSGLLLVLISPCICLAGKKHGESASWTKFTFTIVILPALFVLVSFPILMLGYGSR